MVKNPPDNAGDVGNMGSIPELGRSPGGGHSSPLQYSCLENSMGRGALWVTLDRVSRSQTRLKRLNTHARRTKEASIMSATDAECIVHFKELGCVVQLTT